MGLGPRWRSALFAALIGLAISAPTSTSVAATSAGQLYAFGRNAAGELGSAANLQTNDPNPTPALVALPGASGPVTQVAAGELHSLALTSSGQLYAFGSNRYGQLGSAGNSGTDNPNPTPALVTLPGASGPVTQVAGGESHSLAATSSGQLYAFGKNNHGQLGSTANNGTFNPNPTPALVALPGASGPVTQVAAGELHSLALTSSGQLYAFGDNYYGQLGSTTNNGTSKATPTPTEVTLPVASGPVIQIAAGAYYSLALTSSGQLYAFGSNRYGQLGSAGNSGTDNPNPTPMLVSLPEASGPVTQVASGRAFGLALTSSGQLYAFGINYSGQLGTTANSGTEIPNPTPTLVSLPGASSLVTQVAAGAWHSLALTSSGQLYTFGGNSYGQLGSAINNGAEKPNPTPALVDLGAGTTIDTMAPGPLAGHTLVVTANLAVTSDSLPAGRVGTPYSATATAGGGRAPYSWHANGLPAGLSISSASGQISGTPQAEGTTQVSLSVSDRFGIIAKSAPITLAIEGALPSPMAKRPVLTKLRQSHRRWRRGRSLAQISSLVARREGRRIPLGTTFSFKLNRRAKVGLVFERCKGTCFKRAAVLSFAGHLGKNRIRFQGRISHHRTLKPGRYKMTATARSGGLRSKPMSVSFAIVR